MEFETTKNNKKYCSTICYSRAKAIRYYRKYGAGEGVCIHCGEEYRKIRYRQKYCSKKCSSLASRKYLDVPDCLENADRKIDKNIGYVRVYVPMHPEANSWGYVYEHRIIAEKMIGRKLLKDEVVHHKNGKRWDNSENNLQVMDRYKHSKLKKMAQMPK